MQSQRLWEKWINFDCEPADTHFTSSHVPVDIAFCKARYMKQREEYLRELYQAPYPAVS